MICHSVSHLLVSSFTVNSLSFPSASNLPCVPPCVPLYHHCVQHVTTLCARIVSQLRPTNNQGCVMTSIWYHALGLSATSLLFFTFLNKYPNVIKQNQEVMRLTWRVELATLFPSMSVFEGQNIFISGLCCSMSNVSIWFVLRRCLTM